MSHPRFFWGRKNKPLTDGRESLNNPMKKLIIFLAVGLSLVLSFRMAGGTGLFFDRPLDFHFAG